jgi:hypothetical protein
MSTLTHLVTKNDVYDVDAHACIDGVVYTWEILRIRHNDLESMEKIFNVLQNWLNKTGGILLLKVFWNARTTR